MNTRLPSDPRRCIGSSPCSYRKDGICPNPLQNHKDGACSKHTASLVVRMLQKIPDNDSAVCW